jgi:methyltransferase-like protein 6
MVHFHENDFDYDEFVARVRGDVTLPPLMGPTEATALLQRATKTPRWDDFYRREPDPYKPRRYLSAEFPELLQSPYWISRWIRSTWQQNIFARSGALSPLLFDVGCGYGSALIPLLRENPCLRAVACDLSPFAIEKLASLNEFKERIRSRAWDITTGLPPEMLNSDKADFALLIFTLSAINPALHVQVLRDLRSALRPGSGIICFRDRALFDLSMIRSKIRIADATFAREVHVLFLSFKVLFSVRRIMFSVRRVIE